MYIEKNQKLDSHIELVQIERKDTEALRLEVEKEIESLVHFIKLAEQENWRTASDQKKLQEQKRKVATRLNALEVCCYSF